MHTLARKNKHLKMQTNAKKREVYLDLPLLSSATNLMSLQLSCLCTYRLNLRSTTNVDDES